MTAFDLQILVWLAAGLTLATVFCHDMRRLRLLALAANAAFIGYGAAVLLLHLALVPVNLWRLNQAFRVVPVRPAAPALAVSPSRTAARRRRPRSWRAASASLRREQDGVASGGARHAAHSGDLDMPRQPRLATSRFHRHRPEGTQ